MLLEVENFLASLEDELKEMTNQRTVYDEQTLEVKELFEEEEYEKSREILNKVIEEASSQKSRTKSEMDEILKSLDKGRTTGEENQFISGELCYQANIV